MGPRRPVDASHRSPDRAVATTVAAHARSGDGVRVRRATERRLVRTHRAGHRHQSGIAWHDARILRGAIVFSVANRLLTRPSKQPTERDITTSTSGLTIVLGALLDGIPESAVLGLTLLQDGRISAAMLVAVVISNLPEGIAATVGLRSSGWPTVKVILLWTGVIAVSRALRGRRLRRARRGVAVHARLRAGVRRRRDPVHALHVDDARGVRTRRPGRGHGHGVRIRCRPHGQLAAGMSSTNADR